MDNVRGSIFMVLAMAAFALEDMFIKAASVSLPVGEVLILFGLGGTLIFGGLTLLRGEQLFPAAFWSLSILLKSVFEIAGRVFYTLAITLTTLSSASAILQATPLVVVMGAALLFGERVGWRRWLAILIGFSGVLMILRPGVEGFEALSILAVLGMLGFAGRDLATRGAPKVLSHMQLGFNGFLMLIPAGTGLLWYSGSPALPDANGLLQLGAAIFFGVIAYYSLTVAMRSGEVAVVTPFRYTRLVFALILAVLVFDERPDLLTLLGSVVVVGSGIYTLLRQRRSERPARLIKPVKH